MVETITPTGEERPPDGRGDYEAAVSPTAPGSVTPATSLHELNLNWRESDLPERERTKHVHRLHPYLGKFIPQLVEVFLRKYFRPGQTVLDPFCGSGTALVQANELGVHAIGYDVSAFNVLLTRAKTRRYNLPQVRQEILHILDQASQAAAAAEWGALWAGAGDYLRQWFAPQALAELLTYRDLIAQHENQDILKVILSRSARSARLTTHFDLDFPQMPQTAPYWCYKHSRTCAPTTQAARFLRRYSLDTIRRLEQFAVRQTGATIQVERQDSRQAVIPPADGVITSPPYVGLIDYHEQHRYAYELLGLEDLRSAEIGAAEQGNSQRAQRIYQEAVAAVFTRVIAALPAGGPLIVVATDKYGLYDAIAAACGVEVEAALARHVNRRTGRRSAEFYESVFIWRKR